MITPNFLVLNLHKRPSQITSAKEDVAITGTFSWDYNSTLPLPPFLSDLDTVYERILTYAFLLSLVNQVFVRETQSMKQLLSQSVIKRRVGTMSLLLQDALGFIV